MNILGWKKKLYSWLDLSCTHPHVKHYSYKKKLLYTLKKFAIHQDKNIGHIYRLGHTILVPLG